jgi:chemotaxis protein MotB
MDNRKIALAALAIAAVGAAAAVLFAARGRAAVTEARVLRAEMALLTQARDDASKQTLAQRVELDRMAAALSKVETELEAAKRANIDLGNKLAGYSEELVRKQSELRQVGETQQQLAEQLRLELDDHKISIARLGNSLSVNLVGQMLFGSGQAGLTAEGADVLTRVGTVIKQATGRTIRVVGHTDNRPISAARQGLYPTNWELSTARAATVVRFLVGPVGIAPERCEAVGMGEFQPVASNETSAGRMQNRRIEILLAPPLQRGDTATESTAPQTDAAPAGVPPAAAAEGGGPALVPDR